MTDARKPITPADLPLELPEPCPICGAKVLLTGVQAWCPDDGSFDTVDLDCETEPDIDGPDWPDWHRGHFSMPYVDWLPYENRMLDWLDETYFWVAT